MANIEYRPMLPDALRPIRRFISPEDALFIINALYDIDEGKEPCEPPESFRMIWLSMRTEVDKRQEVVSRKREAQRRSAERTNGMRGRDGNRDKGSEEKGSEETAPVSDSQFPLPSPSSDFMRKTAFALVDVVDAKRPLQFGAVNDSSFEVGRLDPVKLAECIAHEPPETKNRKIYVALLKSLGSADFLETLRECWREILKNKWGPVATHPDALIGRLRKVERQKAIQ